MSVGGWLDGVTMKWKIFSGVYKSPDPSKYVNFTAQLYVWCYTLSLLTASNNPFLSRARPCNATISSSPDHSSITWYRPRHPSCSVLQPNSLMMLPSMSRTRILVSATTISPSLVTQTLVMSLNLRLLPFLPIFLIQDSCQKSNLNGKWCQLLAKWRHHGVKSSFKQKYLMRVLSAVEIFLRQVPD